MNRYPRSCVILVYLAVLGFLGPQSFAQSSQPLYVNNTQVYLRSSPTAASRNIITTVPKDTPVSLLSSEGAWYNVRLPNGQEGWISKWLLTSPTTSSRPGARSITATTPDAPPAQASDTQGKMVFIPGEEAIIGNNRTELTFIIHTWNASSEALNDEAPQQRISVRGFYLDQYEVTNAQYKEFIDATNYPPPLDWDGSLYPPGKADHPVTFVSWDDAQAYAQWAGKRLPTAEEWELAARGPQGQRFPWGDTFDIHQVNVNLPKGGTAPVGSFSDDVSPYQVYDMGGNVMEWTLSQYQKTKDFFIIKGGAWNGPPFEARGANNTPGEAIYQLSHIGFRCARSETPQ